MEKKQNRRSFIKQLSYGSGTLLLTVGGTFFIFRETSTADKLVSYLRKNIRGKVIIDAVELNEFVTNYGHFERKSPRVVVSPKDASDVSVVFDIANRYKVPVHLRGNGHSCSSLNISAGGIIIDNSSEYPDYYLGEGVVNASSKMRTYHLQQELRHQGLSIPTWISGPQTMTIGGLISAGGIGHYALDHSYVVTNISKLDLVTPTGEIKKSCSMSKDSDLFRYSLCGIGQISYIERLELKTIKLERWVSMRRIIEINSEGMISRLKHIYTLAEQGKINFFTMIWPRTGLKSTMFSYFGPDLYAYFEAGKLFESEERAKEYDFDTEGERDFIPDYFQWNTRGGTLITIGKPTSYKLWANYAFCNENWEEFLLRTTKHFDDTNLRDYFTIASQMFKIKTNHNIPFVPIKATGKKVGVAFTIQCPLVEYGNTEQLNTFLKEFEKMTEHCVSLGGRPYLSGRSLVLNREQQLELYGDDFRKFLELKSQIDPNNILNPYTWGYEI